jgi:hypothetical protein
MKLRRDRGSGDDYGGASTAWIPIAISPQTRLSLLKLGRLAKGHVIGS